MLRLCAPLSARQFLPVSGHTGWPSPTSLEAISYAPPDWELTGCRGGF